MTPRLLAAAKALREFIEVHTTVAYDDGPDGMRLLVADNFELKGLVREMLTEFDAALAEEEKEET